MRAARLHAAGDLRVGAEPTPEAGPGMSLVRVTAVGICGSDLHWWDEGAIGDAMLAHPLVLGHEGAGVIAEGPRRGERVAIDPAIACGTCRACRDGYANLCYRIRFAGHGETDGMMREFMTWPAELLHPLPDGVLGCGRGPAGAARGGVAQRGSRAPGVRRHRVGGGVRADRAAAHRGAEGGGGQFGTGRRAAGTPARGGRAVRRGPGGRTRHGVGVRARAGGLGVDVAFEAAGTDEAVRLAVESVRPGGRVVLAGIPGDDAIGFQASVARRKGLTIAMVRRMNHVYPRAIGLAARGVVDLGLLVSRRAGLGEAKDAFGEAARRTGLKVIIEPQR